MGGSVCLCACVFDFPYACAFVSSYICVSLHGALRK